MTDEQAKMMGEMAGRAFADKMIRWLESGNRNAATVYSAEWFVKTLGEAIGRGIAKEQKAGN